MADPLAREHHPRIAGQVFQHGELLGRKRDALPAAGGGAGGAVHPQVPHGDDVADLVAAAADQHPQPGQQFGQRKGLDEVIVGAAVQPAHPVLDPVPRGQQQHGGLVAGGTAAAQHLQPVHPRQHHVQHHGVVFPARQIFQRVVPVQAAVHAVMGGRELLDQQGVHLRLILHHQDAHGSFLLVFVLSTIIPQKDERCMRMTGDFWGAGGREIKK